MNKFRFITQFKIEFLLPFTSCREVLVKIPDWVVGSATLCHFDDTCQKIRLRVAPNKISFVNQQLCII